MDSSVTRSASEESQDLDFSDFSDDSEFNAILRQVAEECPVVRKALKTKKTKGPIDKTCTLVEYSAANEASCQDESPVKFAAQVEIGNATEEKGSFLTNCDVNTTMNDHSNFDECKVLTAVCQLGQDNNLQNGRSTNEGSSEVYDQGNSANADLEFREMRYNILDHQEEITSPKHKNGTSTNEGSSELNDPLLDLDSEMRYNHSDQEEESISPKQNFRKLQSSLRKKGESYIGFSRPRNCTNPKQNIERPSRHIGPTCTSKFCKTSRTRDCENITEEMREAVFKKFWKSMTRDQQKVYVVNNVKAVPPKQRYTSKEESRRNITLCYRLCCKNESYRVCKKMFLNTLGVGEAMVRDWVLKSEHGMCTSKAIENQFRKKNERLQETSTEKYVHLNEFFDSLPKLPSHYGRKDSSKLYLEQNIDSLATLYRIYTKKMEEDNKIPLGRTIFEKTFAQKNLSIYQLKKDKCNVCSEHEVGNLSDAEWNNHFERKQRARNEKDTDKELAIANSNVTVLTMDLQAVKVSPCLNANATFYKTKLCCHNFTIYNLATRHVMCYWFSETDCELSASTFATCVIHYLENFCTSKNIIII